VITRRYAWYVLAVLTSLNFVNYVDRMLIVGMYDQFREQFHLSNTQIGALQASFFIVHALLILPFGWLGDRVDRRTVIAVGAIVWSLATLGTAYALGFATLILLRSLVGVGEAAYLPVSNAILCESFRPDEKARTIACFNIGMFAGACVGLLIGVQLGFPLAFQVVAAPGIALGVLALCLRVPARREGAQPVSGIRVGRFLADSWRALRYPSVRWMLGAGILISFTAGGFVAWVPDFMDHSKGLTTREATRTLFLLIVTSGPLGVFVGGRVADALYRRFRFGRPITIAISFLLATPCAFGVIYLPMGASWYVCAWLLNFFLPWYNGPMAASVDDVVDDEESSTAQGGFSALIHLVGTGPGSIVVGAAITRWSYETALLFPTFACLLAVPFCLIACARIGRDMDAREERAGRRAASSP